jgi:hypothetical protein
LAHSHVFSATNELEVCCQKKAFCGPGMNLRTVIHGLIVCNSLLKDKLFQELHKTVGNTSVLSSQELISMRGIHHPVSLYIKQEFRQEVCFHTVSGI